MTLRSLLLTGAVGTSWTAPNDVGGITERIRALAVGPHYHGESGGGHSIYGGGVDVQPITLLMNWHPEVKD